MSRTRNGCAAPCVELGGHDFNPAVLPFLNQVGRRAGVRDDRGDPLRRYERKKRRSGPLRLVEDPDHALAHVGHLALDANLVGIEIHEPAIEADSTRAEEALADARSPE